MNTIGRYSVKRVLKTTSDDDRKQIISAYENGFSPSTISHMLDIKKTTVYGIIKRYKETWQIEAKKRGGNHAKLLTKEAVDSIREWIAEDNSITLTALAEKVFVKHGVRAGISTISKEVKELNRSLKKTKSEPKMVQEVRKICHFCLNQNEETLVLLTNILDSYLTVENVERFTGVSIKLNDRPIYAVCPDCTSTLQNSILFRMSCIRNDAYLREHFPLDINEPTSSNARNEQDPLEMENDSTLFEIYEPITSRQDFDSSQATLETKNTIKQQVVVKKDFDSSNFLEPSTIQNSGSSRRLTVRNTVELVGVKEQLDSATYTEPSIAQVSDSRPTLNHPIKPEFKNVEEEFYSANYIEPGEPTVSGNEDNDLDETYSASYSSNLGIVQRPYKKRCGYKNEVNPSNISRRPQNMLCNICGKFIKNLDNHMVTHTQEAKHACPHCPKRMTHDANLLRHIKSVHLKLLTNSCEVCGKGFTSTSSLVCHLHSHHTIGKLHECKVCSKKYGHPNGLREHFKRVHGSQCHECVTCGIGFTTRQSLKTHQAVHSAQKPYVCSECPKRFKSSFAKNTHQVTHSGILFKCTVCDKSYRYKSLLSMHLRKMHASNDDNTINDDDRE